MTALPDIHPPKTRARRRRNSLTPWLFLAPGMPVEGHILVGERSFFRYLAQPVLDSFHRAFHEQ